MKLRIKEQIKASGVTKQFIVNNLDISRNTLDNWIEGKTLIPLKHAVKLAKLLRCELNDLWEE